MTNGRQKGSVAEREVAGLVEAWWSPFEPSRFVRTPLSGGWGDEEVRAGFRTSGDIMTTAKRFPFCIEVKRREGWAESTFKNGRPSPIWSWWIQVQVAAREMDAVPMLWFRRNRADWRVLVPDTFRLAMESVGYFAGFPDVDWFIKANAFVGVPVGLYPTCYRAIDVLAWNPAKVVAARSSWVKPRREPQRGSPPSPGAPARSSGRSTRRSTKTST